MSKELFDKIKQAQKLAGEQVVLDGLKEKGLIPESKEPQGEDDFFNDLDPSILNRPFGNNKDSWKRYFINCINSSSVRDRGLIFENVWEAASTPQEGQEELWQEAWEILRSETELWEDRTTQLKQSFTITRKP